MNYCGFASVEFCSLCSQKRVTMVDRLQDVMDRGCSANCANREFWWTDEYQVYCCNTDRCNDASIARVKIFTIFVASAVAVVLFTFTTVFVFQWHLSRWSMLWGKLLLKRFFNTHFSELTFLSKWTVVKCFIEGHHVRKSYLHDKTIRSDMNDYEMLLSSPVNTISLRGPCIF